MVSHAMDKRAENALIESGDSSRGGSGAVRNAISQPCAEFQPTLSDQKVAKLFSHRALFQDGPVYGSPERVVLAEGRNTISGHIRQT